MPKELDRGGKMDERTPVCHAESSVTERVVIVMQLEEITSLKQLKEWANQPTEGVNIPF